MKQITGEIPIRNIYKNLKSERIWQAVRMRKQYVSL